MSSAIAYIESPHDSTQGRRVPPLPTPEQAEQLAQIVGACRFVYNLALEQRRDFWRQYRRHRGANISFASQCRELTDLRREIDWLRAVPVLSFATGLARSQARLCEFLQGACRLSHAPAQRHQRCVPFSRSETIRVCAHRHIIRTLEASQTRLDRLARKTLAGIVRRPV